jgi:pimeloyl-ACP methyl ester carboxylesterase
MATFVLVHGHWHGPWCWELVEERLLAAGHEVVSPTLPCERREAGCTANAQAVGDAASRSLQRPLVLVGHSAGGMTIPLVADPLDASHLVFVASLLPTPGKTMDQQFAEEPIIDPAFTFVDAGDGLSHVPADDAIRFFYHDCDPPAAQMAAARLRRQTLTPLTEVTPLGAWPAIAKTYVACRFDRVIQPRWQLTAPKERLGATIVPLDSGHSPMLSRPEELTEILLRTAV